MGGGQICYVGGGQDSGEIRFKAKGQKVERVRESGSGCGRDDRGRWWLWLEWKKEMRELKL